MSGAPRRWRHEAAAIAGELVPKGGRADVAAAAIVVAIVLAMLLPLPPWLLDILIAINMCVACLMVVLVVQVKDSVSLSTFPALLLITTLFRVALSVASTRLILLEAEAGHIIEAFGEVVVGGNLVVGLVVFLILTVVQFLVITKGSERVAEVGARFTLDAMPGKQLAIDMEFKGGSMTADEARQKRALLGQESQFFGAMDGAMKFVKGDAIAGIVIMLTNMIGGLAIGMLQRDMPGAEAMRVYSVLTIGDGLVAQVPALLMSLTAGLLVTRVAGGEDGGRNVGKEVASQLAAHPKAWVTASVAMLVFGLLPGMPTVVFAALAGGALALGLGIIHRRQKNTADAAAGLAAEVPELREFEVVRHFLVRIAPHVDAERGQQIINLARLARNELVSQYGMVTPPVHADTGAPVADADFEFCHDEVRVFSARLHEDLLTALCQPRQVEALDLAHGLAEEVAEWDGRVRAWLTLEQAEALALPAAAVQTYWAYLHSLFRSAIVKAGPRYFGIEQAQKLSRWIASRTPDLAKELERSVPLARLADVMQRLLGEQVSVRNVDAITETLVEWGPRERDPAVLYECVRAALAREICDAHASGKQLSALMLDAELEAALRSAVRQTAYGDWLALDVRASEALVDEFAAALTAAATLPSPILLCPPDLRPHARHLLRERFNELPVLSTAEVPPDYRIKVLSVVSWPDAAGPLDAEYAT
ncbi:type III secretion system export apparatus subunit SctV [Duganella violaceipulchra]|uniref:Type III secretion protein V n=1 Tax=Duganella violaceipulchra TaxID=2849652 RepID=A0AA41H8D1_9BURK|nr:type III secretion system export apparatus subunit SctV [Duganella violaceicalia]MBV6322484.1 type III secretion system export apparatus subunit SctV [Duganella violaceicalia]MCP2010691.1 type III secretion protein V [Duganella violaceicalia]